jgi:toxin ParE1/3/4
MSGRVVKHPRVFIDLDEQATYLQSDSLRVAIRFLEQAEQTFEMLAGMPGLGKAYDSDAPRLAGLRSFGIKGFDKILVFYRPIKGGIEVVRVLHSARDIPKILEEELD